MNTIIEYTAEQAADSSGKLLHTMLLLARNFLGQMDTGIHPRHAWDAHRFMPDVPSRVWRRHSELLSLLVEQANTDEPQFGKSSD